MAGNNRANLHNARIKNRKMLGLWKARHENRVDTKSA
jgi:hypothetical protein